MVAMHEAKCVNEDHIHRNPAALAQDCFYPTQAAYGKKLHVIKTIVSTKEQSNGFRYYR